MNINCEVCGGSIIGVAVKCADCGRLMHIGCAEHCDTCGIALCPECHKDFGFCNKCLDKYYDSEGK